MLVDLLGHAHINICIALFGGLVTFLSGIETASKHEVIMMWQLCILQHFYEI